MTELCVGDRLAARRAEEGPCACSDAPDCGAELLSREERGEDVFERLRCPCDRIWRRVWIGGYG